MRESNLRSLSAAAVLAAALVAAPLASATTSTAGTGQETHQRTETIELVAKQTQSASLDLGSKGLSQGDENIIAEDLYRDGRKIGDHSVVCTYVHINPDELQCVGTFALPQGQVTSQALLHLPPAPAIDIAITGGSGAYRTARGYVHTVPAGQTERRLTFHITFDEPSAS
ncbi:hypothetical protein GCM10011579_060320 [Streptomyces albiflavescens]|uniref:Allene oxide cyclase barrel-like domain-containing protein n=1 Tax=Streptomyces albiflavescens TaxID=1623582 RepID=A0A917YAD9_9ACTN|nr:hypothetical protein [Streptomyces albiflavescens]GGN77779.1 hypothetical protein GCM10011579_060320 [Streptomyces albiflavescens]